MPQGPVSTGTDGTPASAEGVGEPIPVPPAIRALRARRRRRRKPPEVHAQAGTAPQTPGGDAESTTSGDTTAVASTAAPADQTAERSPRSRHRRRRRAAAGDEANAERRPPEDRGPRREGRDRFGRQGERGPRGDRQDRGREGGPRDRRGRPPGRGRDAPPRKVERKIYHIDAVVDRGFEDVEEEGGTRRVNWTILKRTTADLISRKALSAVYVLQRDGSDTEFPSLGAARDTVHKTIVHPEKLTRSKAEHAAEKK